MHGLYFQVRAGPDSRYAASFIARYSLLLLLGTAGVLSKPLYLSMTADPPHVTEITTGGDLI